ncbi:PrpF protein [Fomitopsis serialis]|uniref:PrpF protein n=1 Tax=Fomitopsis serialis TaxID=139415 RepID=UPI002007CB63|nr:PrpF protein [Neoantrodia serialis]KAH9928395.1 PrpF protein [Neoantrodia serialis]
MPHAQSIQVDVCLSNPIPASFMRGGTSKGIYLNRADLPGDTAQWDPIFLGIMGSPDPKYGRQLNGMGGGVSSLSKVCVVGAASEEQRAAGIDVEYTFAQVGIRDELVDYSGNCGNLSSMIGVFALDEGLCALRTVDTSARVPTATVTAWNTNTQKRIDATFPVSLDDGQPTALLDLEEETMAGVSGKASRITLDFVSPGGARTGKLLPTAQPVDTVQFASGGGAAAVPMSLVDATNPTVFITADGLRAAVPDTTASDYTSVHIQLAVEQLRRLGAERMGLDPEAEAQPKIAILSEPAADDSQADIVVHAYSMGVLHKAVPMTLGLCLGVAAGVEGSIPWQIARARGAQISTTTGDSMVRIRHPGGVVTVGAARKDGEVSSAKVVRTGRRLMKGVVWW